MRVMLTALMVCLGMAEVVRAQIPRDPFAGPPATTDAAASKSLPAPFVTRQNDVEIPFSVRPGTTAESQPAAVRVFVSWDRGKAWHFYDERKPEDGRFRFQPKQDGEYWFATQTIDRAGRPDSPEPNRPQLRLVVDTQRPQLLVQAQTQPSGEVALSWNAADPTLNPATLKFEYQDASGSGNWEAVTVTSTGDPASGQTQGKAAFRPVASGKSINLRAEVADAGGNVAYFSQRLSLISVKPKSADGLAYAPPTADPSATSWPSEAASPRNPQANQWLASDASHTQSGGGEDVRIPGLVQNPFTNPGRLASSPQAPASPREEILPPPNQPTGDAETGTSSGMTDANRLTDGNHSAARNSEYGPISSESAESPSATKPPSEYGGTEQEPKPVGDLPGGDELLPPRDSGYSPSPQPRDEGSATAPNFGPEPEVMPAPQPDEPAPAGEAVESPFGSRPRLTNSRRFSLDYDVEAVGPEGVAAVELWGTTDSGQTWAKWGSDPDRASPFDVEVNSEATYGFRIVIVGKSGLATSAPQAGDAADIWVGIDATRPTARLTGAAYGQGEAAGKLDIRWEAADANLGPRPVTLAIGDRPDGQFTPIAAGLPNTGQYYWEYDPRSPRQIYLRLEVRDEAGNIAIDQLTEPIKVEGLEPKGRIRGFNPAAETPRGAFRSPLFR